MATQNHVVVKNIRPFASTSNTNQIFVLTRAMKKAGWKVRASGNGSTKSVSNDPNADLWGGAGNVTNVGAGAASITANTRGRATITGLTGIVGADKGRFLRIQNSGSSNNGYHQIEEILSSTSVKIDARTATITAPDANNGSLTWEIRDPTDALAGSTPAIPFSGLAAWWLAEGPTTLQIPITIAPVAGPQGLVFLRGENIAQASSGFNGEILGYVFEPVSSTGYLVVSPRVRGTGGGVYGLTDGQTFTGAVSGSTVAQNGTAVAWVHQTVIYKGTAANTGGILHGVFNPVADSATMFSALASSAGCTSTVPPGCGGTGNAFPARAWVGLGTSTATAFLWCGTSQTRTAGNAQIICADLLEEDNYTADGSWFIALANGETNGGGYVGYAFQRLEDTEDGDVHPYVSIDHTNSGPYARVATTSGAQAANNPPIHSDSFNTTSWGNTSIMSPFSFFAGFRGLGLAIEGFQGFEFCYVASGQSVAANNNDRSALAVNYTDGEKVATAPTTVRVREPIWVRSVQFNKKMTKGTLKWMGMVSGGAICDLLDGGRYMQLSSTAIAFYVGPWVSTVGVPEIF